MVTEQQFASLDERVTRLELWRKHKNEHTEYLIKEHNDLLQLLLEKVNLIEEKMVTRSDFDVFKKEIVQLLTRQN